MEHITVAVVPIVDSVPYFLALKEGYFRQEGLSVTTKIVTTSTQAIPALLDGQTQVVAGANYVSFLSAEIHGVGDFSIVAPDSSCAPQANTVLVMPGSNIQSVPDLAHKTIAVNVNPNVQTLMINSVLQDYGMNPDTVTYVAIPFAHMAAALSAGTVDAVAAVEPFATTMEESYGALQVIDECSGQNEDVPLAGNIATRAWVQKNRATALAYQRAIEMGNALADTNRGAVDQILPTYIKGVNSVEVANLNLDHFPTEQSAVLDQQVCDLMLQGGMVKSVYKVGPLLLTSLSNG
jgi:NitT/TauT family transport system substrate-binding protein